MLKTKLTKKLEETSIRYLSKMGTFICPEVGINIKRFGFPNWYKRKQNLTDEDLEKMGYKPSWHTDTEIVDILSWDSKPNIWKCYELKVSLNDFRSSCAHTFVGHYNYYIIPKDLVTFIEKDVPDYIGIYTYYEPEVDKWRYLECYKKAKKQELNCTQDELYYAMIKSLYREYKKLK